MGKNSLINKLRGRFDDAKRAREAKEALEQPFKDRLIAIFTAPRHVNTDFWCDVCKRDCSGTGYRQVCTVREWAPTAWYVANCPKGHKMLRRITDKDSDPFYERSEMVQRHRYELRDAFLTPADPRFKEVYPEKWAELMKKG